LTHIFRSTALLILLALSGQSALLAAQCRATFTDGLTNSNNGGNIKFEDSAQLLQNPDTILATTNIDNNGSVLSCDSANCSASGTIVPQLNSSYIGYSSNTNLEVDSTTQTISANDYKDVKVKSGGSLFMSATYSSYHFKKLNVESNSFIYLTPGDYFLEEIEIKGTSQLIVQGAGTVRVYIKNKAKFKESSVINGGQSGDPSKLVVYFFAEDDDKIKVESAASFAGYIYSERKVEVKDDNSTVLGAISSEDELKLKDDSSVTYDDSIDDTDFGDMCDPSSMVNPTVTSQTTSDTTPIISGTYTSSVATSLTVTVNSVIYTLSTSSELTNSSDNWSLDLSSITPLSFGTYEVVATSSDGSSSLSDTTSDELIIQALGGCSIYFPDSIQGHTSSSEIKFDNSGQVIGDSDATLTFPSVDGDGGGTNTCNTADCVVSGTFAPALTLPTFVTSSSSTDIAPSNTTVTIGPTGTYPTTQIDNLTINNNDNVTFQASASEYIIENALFDGGVTTFNPGTYWFNELEIKGDSKLIMNGAVTFYVNGQSDHFDIEDTAEVNLGGVAQNLAIVSYEKMHMKDDSKVNAVLYSTGSEIKLQDSAQHTGVISSAGTVEIKGTATSTYEDSNNVQIGDLCGGTPSTVTDHLSFSHSGTGINCIASNITLSAHTDDPPVHVIDSGYIGTVNLTTSTENGKWDYVSGGNISNFTPSNNFDGIASYTFDGSETTPGSVVLSLFNPVAGPLYLEANDGTITHASGVANESSDYPELTFNQSGFRFVDSDDNELTIGVQIAGKPSDVGYAAQSLYLQAYDTDLETGNCETALTDDVDVTMSLNCSNPVTCARSIYIRDDDDDPSTFVEVPDSGAIVSLNFGDNTEDKAEFMINYPDSGSVSLSATATVDDVTYTDNSNQFVSRPFGFHITATENPGATGPGVAGEGYVSAGTPFEVTVNASLWEQTDDTDDDGIADGHDDTDATNNVNLSDNAVPLGGTTYQSLANDSLISFGQESETVTLSSVLQQPAGGTDPGLGGGTTLSAFTNGTDSSSTVTFFEVGIIEIAAGITGNYLTLDSTETDKMISKSGRVGRFYPADFLMEVVDDGAFLGANQNGALDFSYIGQPFGYDPGGLPQFKVTARSLGGVSVTTNYTNSWANIDENSITTFTAPTADQTKTGTLGSALTIDYTFDDFSFDPNPLQLGSFLYTFGDDAYFYDRNLNSETSRFDADIDLIVSTVQDSVDTLLIPSTTPASGIVMTPDPVDIRFGRMTISNAHGSELRDLTLPMVTEYINDSGFFVVNDLDEDSAVITGNLVIDDQLQPGTAATVVSVATDPGPILGVLDVDLQAPNPTGEGYVDVTPNLGTALIGAIPGAGLPWLQYDWNESNGSFDDNPTGRSTFWIYDGNPVNIYIQQVYQQ
jgi:hypothetical protein